jgi:DNA-directed RNA polymerase specialized sigma24 family protein
MGRDGHDPSRLSVKEVREVLAAMDAGQWKRAERLAKFAAYGLAGIEAEDLLTEICTQLLSGQRRFPRGKPPLIVIKTAMQSLASNSKKSAWATRVDDRWLTEPGPTSDASDACEETRPLAAGAVNGVTPEDEVLFKERLDAILSSSDGDPDAALVLMAWAEGMRGSEAMAATGLDSKSYDAARNRVLRRLAAFSSDEGNK